MTTTAQAEPTRTDIEFKPAGWAVTITLTAAHLAVLGDIAAGRPTNLGGYINGVCERPFSIIDDLERAGLAVCVWQPGRGDVPATTLTGRAVLDMVADYPNTATISHKHGTLVRTSR